MVENAFGVVSEAYTQENRPNMPLPAQKCILNTKGWRGEVGVWQRLAFRGPENHDVC